ncbi:4-hydroxy-tetrahydrodipicolinate reductase [bacterium]|jgi:4-hydroxy-tetrahydrodipicolinate reductase|nr:4-hydroxy-tetrahydrodipicolinate reductase [bacterium]
MISIGLLGASGRMGSQIAGLVRSEFSKTAKITALVSQDDPMDPLLKTDVVIDFSARPATLELVKAALAAKGKLPCFVIGTTGFTDSEKKKIASLAEKAPVMMASNFSTGVLALLEALRELSPKLLKADFHASIHETHHVHKKDSPSGTALTLQKAIDKDVPIESLREGEVIGTHEIIFKGPGETLRISHIAEDRTIFARGAIRAAIELQKKRTKNPQTKGFQ